MPVGLEKKDDPRKKYIKIFMWILTVFMLGSALVFLPSFASGAMLLFSCISVPLKKIQGFWQSKGVKGWVKAVLLIVLFVICIKLYEIR